MKFKFAAILSLVSISYSVFSGTMGPAATSSFGFGAQGLYLEPSFSSQGYIGSTTTYTVNSSNENFIPKDFAYNFGFMVNVFYQFRENNDLNLNWYHYEPSSFYILPVNISVFDNFFLGSSTVRLKPLWNAVNVEFGQRFPIGNWLKVRLHSGVQWANMQLNNFVNGIANINIPQSRSNISKYSGVGVRFGADFNYDLNYGLALTSNLATGLLVGNHSFNRKWNYNGYITANNGSNPAISPEFEGKLGLNYLTNFYLGQVNLNVGWMWVTYLETIETADYGHDGRTKESNFGVQGLYFGANWKGDWI